MTREQYLAKRNELLAKAQKFIDDGKIEDSVTTAKEIETLDKQYQDAATARANLDALTNAVSMAPVAMSMFEGQPLAGDGFVGENLYGSKEYRTAFMNNVLHGTQIPQKFSNANATTKTTDVGAIIPTTIMEKVVEKMESTGMILPLVTRTSYKSGVSVPKATVKPVATWVAEGFTSDIQKKPLGSVTFSHYKLRCAVASTLETTVMTLEMFEKNIIDNIVEAMVKAAEQAIVSGDGTDKPKGFLKETPAKNIDVAKANKLTYQVLCDAEGALPAAYDNTAVWLMTKTTFMKFIGMTDADGQPIARINYGLGTRPERFLLGRPVIINDYMSSYADTVTDDTIVAALYNLKDYIFNTNYEMTVKRYEDNDTDDEVTKAIMVCDGKSTINDSLITITKKNV